MRNRNLKSSIRGLAAAAGCGLLVGCSSSVVVLSDFPTPLIEPLPVRMGVIYDAELYDFVHAEQIPQQSIWTIQLGDANIAMLEPLFDAMFLETREVEDIPVGPVDIARLDGVIHPVLQRFEFDVPIGQRDEFVEVWMQYGLTLYEPDGQVVVEWTVSGYGKSELERNREQSVERAAIVAMREVGAAISTQFAEQAEVAYWLEERQNESALAVDSRIAN